MFKINLDYYLDIITIIMVVIAKECLSFMEVVILQRIVDPQRNFKELIIVVFIAIPS